MRRFKYVGPHDEVEVVGIDGYVHGVVERGKTVDIEDPEVADSLDAQDTWEHVPVSKPRAPRKAASGARKGRKSAASSKAKGKAADQADAPQEPAKGDESEPSTDADTGSQE